MTEPETNRLFGTLSAAFPRAIPEDKIAETSLVYRQFLVDLQYGRAMAVVSKLVKSCKFLPTIAEIREAYSGHQEAEAGKARFALPPSSTDPDMPTTEERIRWAQELVAGLSGKLEAGWVKDVARRAGRPKLAAVKP